LETHSIKRQIKGKLIFTDLDPAYPPKVKRVRRTKKEMEAVRAHEAEWGRKIGKDTPKPKKTSQKLNLEVEQVILKPSMAGIDAAFRDVMGTTKQVEGWVNVFADTRGGYFIGCDIHYTSEEAKAVGDRCSRTCLKPIHISFTIKE